MKPDSRSSAPSTTPCAGHVVADYDGLSNLTAYSDTTVLGNTRDWYRVRATNTSGDSPYSNQANASTASAPNVWINPASDKWEIATNWSQGVPSVAQSVC